MSHKASHWLAEIPPALLKDSDFRVLFHLCDAHNSKRDPQTACFPGQALLREATGLSNGGLNNALNRIEGAGLMRRRRTRNLDGTKGPTYYILGCDFDEAQPTPQNGVGENGEHGEEVVADSAPEAPAEKSVDKSATISTSGGNPSPHRRANQLHARGDKPVIDPKKEPSAGNSANSRLSSVSGLIQSGKAFLCTHISSQSARACIEAGLVSPGDCAKVGIPI